MEGHRGMANCQGNSEAASYPMAHRLMDLVKGMLKGTAHAQFSTLCEHIYTVSHLQATRLPMTFLT